jgi:hypothetical protein
MKDVSTWNRGANGVDVVSTDVIIVVIPNAGRLQNGPQTDGAGDLVFIDVSVVTHRTAPSRFFLSDLPFFSVATLVMLDASSALLFKRVQVMYVFVFYRSSVIVYHEVI